MVRSARCCCGAIMIEVEGEPVINAVCHCHDCKRRTGSAFGHSAYFRDSQVLRTRGETTTYALTGATPQQRFFCPRCGTTLYWTSEAFPKMTGVAGGCFVDPPLPEPTLTVSNDKRCAWLQLPSSWATSLA